MDVAVIGAGRVGTAMAVLLQRAGHRIVAVSGGGRTRARAERSLPGVPFRPNDAAARDAQVALIGTADDEIAATCEGLAAAGAVGAGSAVAHLSGAAGLAALDAARGAGATVLCVHPLQTCPSVDAALERLPGSAFAVTSAVEEGLALGERLARDVGGRPFRLDDARRPLYHAAAVLASNDVVALTALAEDVARTAGVPDPLGALAPLQRATLDNVAELGAADALTGPAVRGDAGTVERNLRALDEHAPHAVAAYVALAVVALDLAEASGRLVPEGRAAVEEVLARWR